MARTRGGVVLGPAAFFDAQRQFWGSLMNRDATESVDVLCSLPQLGAPVYDAELNVAELRDAVAKLKTWSSAGLDGWPPATLRLLPDQALDVQAHRPISIASSWYRLWAAWRLRCLPPEVWRSIAISQCGGLAGRDPTCLMLRAMCEIERAQLDREPESGIGIISLDAVKCFDKLSYPHVLQSATTLGIPHHIMKALITFCTSSKRLLSAHSKIDREGFKTCNGVPQGCALSVLMCVSMVQGWTRAVQGAQISTLSFVDDRYIWSGDGPSLTTSWKKSCDWEKTEKWELNQEKSVLIAAGRFRVSQADIPLRQAETLRALGTETPLCGGRNTPLNQERCKSTRLMAERISLIPLPLPLLHRLLMTVALPRFAYMLVPKLPRRHDMRKLTAAIQRAAGLKNRRLSWHAWCGLAAPTHRIDPLSVQTYLHVRAVCLSRRRDPDLNAFWTHSASLPQPQQPRGPIGVWKSLLRTLHVTEAEDTTLTHPDLEPRSLLRSDWGVLKTFWQKVIQLAMLRQAEARRPNLQGTGGCHGLAQQASPAQKSPFSLPIRVSLHPL